MAINGNLAEQVSSKKIINSRFGEISVNLENTINFPFGLLGFEGFKQYVLSEFPGDNLPGFKILQSVEDDELSFVVLPLSQGTELIEQLEAGLMTNSKAEQLAIRGGRITSLSGNENFIIGGDGDFRPEHWRDFSNNPGRREV